MKSIYRAMQEGKHYGTCKDLTEEQISWWTSHVLDFGERKQIMSTEEEYREAYLLWKEENPAKRNIPLSTIITLSSGKEVSLGKRIENMKLVYQAMQRGSLIIVIQI